MLECIFSVSSWKQHEVNQKVRFFSLSTNYTTTLHVCVSRTGNAFNLSYVLLFSRNKWVVGVWLDCRVYILYTQWAAFVSSALSQNPKLLKPWNLPVGIERILILYLVSWTLSIADLFYWSWTTGFCHVTTDFIDLVVLVMLMLKDLFNIKEGKKNPFPLDFLNVCLIGLFFM